MPTFTTVRGLPRRAHLIAFTVLFALASPSYARAQSAPTTDAQWAYAAPHFFELMLKFDSLLATKGDAGARVAYDLLDFHGQTLAQLRKDAQRDGPAPTVFNVEGTAPGLALAALTKKWSAASTVGWQDVVRDLQPVCGSWKTMIQPWFDASRGSEARRGIFVMSMYSMSTIRCAPLQ